MCMMIYLASDKPLRTIDWNEAKPGFHISTPSPEELRVMRHFKKANVVYVGSHEGCGCGFQLGEYSADNYDPGELEQRRRSLHQFAEYLRTELPRVGSIEAFACWDGDQQAPPEHSRTLTPSSLEKEDFFFLEKELSTVAVDDGESTN